MIVGYRLAMLEVVSKDYQRDWLGDPMTLADFEPGQHVSASASRYIAHLQSFRLLRKTFNVELASSQAANVLSLAALDCDRLAACPLGPWLYALISEYGKVLCGLSAPERLGDSGAVLLALYGVLSNSTTIYRATEAQRKSSKANSKLLVLVIT